MKKIIDIPDEIVKDLKILAVKNDKNLKSYIQDLVSNHYNLSNITEMASQGIEDGQTVRFINNYLVKTYEGIKDEVFDYENTEIDSLKTFAKIVKDVCNMIIKNEN